MGGKWGLAIGLREYIYVEWQYLLTDEEILKVMVVPKRIRQIVIGTILFLFFGSFFNVGPYLFATNTLLWILSMITLASGYAICNWLMGRKLMQILPEELLNKRQVRERMPWSKIQSITVKDKRFMITYLEKNGEVGKLMLKLVNDDVIPLQMFLRSKVGEKLLVED